MDPLDNHLWFKMKNISLDDEPGQTALTYLFCYNKQLNFYVTIEGDAAIAGLAGDLGTPEGWQDPLPANQTTYLIRMEVRHAETFYRSALPEIPAFNPIMAGHMDLAPNSKAGPFPDRPNVPPMFMKKPLTFNWSSFLTGLF